MRTPDGQGKGLNFISQVANEVHPGTSLKAGGAGKQSNGCSLCGGHINDPADARRLVTDRMIAECPR